MKKRVLSMIIVLVLLTSLMTGCGSSKESGSADAAVTEGKTYNGVDVSKEVKLTMYLLGEKSADFDKVYEEINKVLKETVNATVEVKFLSWSEHDKKYSLLFSGGEDFDLVFTASSWGHYETTAAMGGFYEITQDFVSQYAPGIAAVVPENAWTQALINGKDYMVPNYQNEFSANVLAVRGDLMKKYGYDDITSWDELVKFYGDVKANESGITPLGTQGSALLWPFLLTKGVDTIGGTPGELFIYNNQDPENLDITYTLDWDGFKEYAQAAKDMFEQGYWSADSMATTEQRQDGLLNGTSASMVWNLDTTKLYAKEANKNHPDWNCTLVDIAPNVKKAINPYINNGMAINATSKNKERAMMVLNEFYTNKTINDLASLGIQGTHWEAVGDKEYKIIDETNYGINNNCNWGWTNANLKREEYIDNAAEIDAKRNTILNTWTADIKPDHVYDGFTFDTTNVSAEVAAVQTVIDQYYKPITYGMAGDVDVAIETLRTQLENAGIQRIQDELNKQAETFVESKQVK